MEGQRRADLYRSARAEGKSYKQIDDKVDYRSCSAYLRKGIAACKSAYYHKVGRVEQQLQQT